VERGRLCRLAEVLAGPRVFAPAQSTQERSLAGACDLLPSAVRLQITMYKQFIDGSRYRGRLSTQGQTLQYLLSSSRKRAMTNETQYLTGRRKPSPFLSFYLIYRLDTIRFNSSQLARA